MQVSREELVESFGQLSDEELLERVRAGTLTELAREVAANELRLRGLEPPAGPSDVAHHETFGEPEASAEAWSGMPGDGDLELVTLRHLTNPLTANVLRTYLQSHGVYVHLWGEHLGTVNIVWSVAAGGMRIQVPRSQVAQAQELIAAWERGELISDDVPE